MTTIPHKAEINARFEDWRTAVDVLTAINSARTVAYAAAKKIDALGLVYQDLDALYLRLCETMRVSPAPVFDHDEHVKQRLAEGHPDYAAAYGAEAPP